jgi:hypothetical protein
MMFLEIIASCVFHRKASTVTAALVMMCAMTTAGMAVANAHRMPSCRILKGTVESGGDGLGDYRVTLYASYIGKRSHWRALGTATTNTDGKFSIRLKRGWQPAVLFVVAEKDSSILASAIGRGPRAPRHVVVNELTTVATGTSFAQFIDGIKIRGNRYGMLNAVKIAEDMANPITGELGAVLANPPNGNGSSTLETFNTLANIVSRVVLWTVNAATTCWRLRWRRTGRLQQRFWTPSPT